MFVAHSSIEAIRLTARDIQRSPSAARANSASTLQKSDLLLQVGDHMLLLLVAPAYQRHQHQPENDQFRFWQSPIKEMQWEILFSENPQPLEAQPLTPQSNFWTLRHDSDCCQFSGTTVFQARLTSGWKDSVIFGVSIVPRAEFALLIVATASTLGQQHLPEAVFPGMILVTLVTSIGVPLVLNRFLDEAEPGF